LSGLAGLLVSSPSGSAPRLRLADPVSGLEVRVDRDGRTLAAVSKSGARAWRVDVAALTPPGHHGEVLKVRALRLADGFVFATLGKSETVRVNMASGKAAYVGSD